MVIEGTEKDIRTYYINLTRLNLEKQNMGLIVRQGILVLTRMQMLTFLISSFTGIKPENRKKRVLCPFSYPYNSRNAETREKRQIKKTITLWDYGN